jgi:hypothetical protein
MKHSVMHHWCIIYQKYNGSSMPKDFTCLENNGDLIDKLEKHRLSFLRFIKKSEISDDTPACRQAGMRKRLHRYEKGDLWGRTWYKIFLKRIWSTED